MARQKRRSPAAPPQATPVPPAPPSATARFGGAELIALAFIILMGLNAWQGRFALNPDGVSYLDLTERLLGGDWGSFVQGYWSPAYPALNALATFVVRDSRAALLITAHFLNWLAVTGAILLLYGWGRKEGGPAFFRAALAALLLASAGLPRIEAVTPDLLLLALMSWLGYELLVHRGARWVITGLLLGAAFLIKTSSWPWLLLTIPLRLWGARDPRSRGAVLRSLPVTGAVMLCWIVPLSVKAGAPTFGSAGRLNYCWYIDACDSRTPDEHIGHHAAYHEAPVDSTRSITWAEFDGGRWTYAPWSDPTAWEAGVLTRRSSAPKLWELTGYWGRQAGQTFGIWLLPMLAGVLLPWCLLEWRPERRRRWIAEGRPALVVALLGVAGIVQFVLIHSEPRLIAPYAILLALGVLHGSLATPAPSLTRSLSIARSVAGWVGLALVALFAYDKVKVGIETDQRLQRVIASVASTRAAMDSQGLSQARVVILGPGIPVEAGAYFSGTHIIAQILPASAAMLDSIPVEERRALLAKLFGGRAQIGWRTTDEGGITFIVIPPR